MERATAEQFAYPSYKWIGPRGFVKNRHGRSISIFSGGIGFSFYDYANEKALRVRLSVVREDGARESYLCDAYYCGEWGAGWQKWQADTLPLFPYEALHGRARHMIFSYNIVKDNLAIPSRYEYRFAALEDFYNGFLCPDDFDDPCLKRENDESISVLDNEALQNAYEEMNRPGNNARIMPFFTRGNPARAGHPLQEIHREIDRVIARKEDRPASPRHIFIAMFDFDNEAVTQHLVYARQKGVRVECIGDWAQVSPLNPSRNIAALRTTGIPVHGVVRNNPVRPDDSMASMHTKFIIFDKDTVHSGSYNLHFHLWGGNWENGLVYRSAAAASLYRGIYEAIKYGQRVKLTVEPANRYNLYYSFGTYVTPCGRRYRPQDAIIAEIARARQSIIICMFDLSNLYGWMEEMDCEIDVIDAIIRARDRGVRVEVFLNGMMAHTGSEPEPWDKDFRRPLKEAIRRLRDAWIELFYVYYWESIHSPLHHKFAVIDGCTVITGSYNWYGPSTYSDEVLSVIRDETIARAFLHEADLIRATFRIRSG